MARNRRRGGITVRLPARGPNPNGRRRRRRNNNRPAAQVVVQRPRRRRQRRQRGGFLNTVGRFAGSALGAVGSGLLGGVAKIFGSGDYVMGGPVSSNSLAGSTPPQFGNASGSTRIRHRELIGDVFSSINFAVNSFEIQPAIPVLFPWAYRICSSYEQYRLMGMVVEYKATSSNALASTNTALGVVGLATLYDASEPDFSSIQEGLNYVGAQSCSPAQSMLHFVECARGQNPLDKLYTRTSDLPSDQDKKFYDMGKINLFTSGQQAAGVTIGQLWISYDIELSKPKLPAGGLTSLAPVDMYFNNAVGSSNINLSGKTNLTVDYPDIANIGTTMINNTVYFSSSAPRGRYMIDVDAVRFGGSGTTGTKLCTGVTYSNCEGVNYLPQTQQSQFSTNFTTNTGTGDYKQSATCVFDIKQSGVASVTFDGVLLQGTAPAELSTYNVVIMVSAIPPLPTMISQKRQLIAVQEQLKQLQEQFYALSRLEHITLEDVDQRDRMESTEIVASK